MHKGEGWNVCSPCHCTVQYMFWFSVIAPHPLRLSLLWWKWDLMRRKWLTHSVWTTTSRMQLWVVVWYLKIFFCPSVLLTSTFITFTFSFPVLFIAFFVFLPPITFSFSHRFLEQCSHSCLFLQCEWLLGDRKPSPEELDKGIDTASPLFQAILDNPVVQLGLTNPKTLLGRCPLESLETLCCSLPYPGVVKMAPHEAIRLLNVIVCGVGTAVSMFCFSKWNPQILKDCCQAGWFQSCVWVWRTFTFGIMGLTVCFLFSDIKYFSAFKLNL